MDGRALADDPKHMLEAALKGFESARQRFLTQAAPGAAPHDVFVSLTEALWWSVSVDEGFENLARTDASYRANLGEYRQARNKDQHGRVLRGLKYARDRCGHQRALVAVEAELTLPARIPMVLGNFFRWRRSDQLPLPDPKFQSAELRPDYDTYLAGQPAPYTLESAAGWFGQEWSRAGL